MIVNKSIFTLMNDIHRKLFDFSITRNGVDLIDIISSIPSKDGYFSQEIKDIYLFKTGQQGAQEFMHLLQNTVDKYVHAKASSSSKDMWVKRIWKWAVGGNNNTVTEKEYNDACKKLYDSIRVGYLAVVTRDDMVIVDYIRGIECEVRSTQNPMIKGLYGDFLKLLEEYQGLPQRAFFYQWYRYTCRTVKSYTLEWSPAWEKILTKPGYSTDVSEWSKKKFDEIQEIENKLASDKCTQLETDNKQSKAKELKAQEKAQQAEEQARQEAVERQRAEKRVEVMCALSTKVSDLKGRDLRAAVNNSINKILEAVLESNLPIKEGLDMIMEQVTHHRKQVIKDGGVRDALLQKVLSSSVLSDVTVSSNTDISRG